MASNSAKNDTEMEENSMEKAKFPPRKYKIIYKSVLLFVYFYLASLHGIYLCFTVAKWQTIVFAFITYVSAQVGLTAGIHRLWSHRSYKAKLPLQIILAFLCTLGYQKTIQSWVRDHRQHHKYSDTDKDPHNASRGLFYSHIGWLLTKKSDEVINCGKKIDMSDIHSNPLLRFQHEYGRSLAAVIAYILPTAIPVYFWNEALFTAWTLNILRYNTNLNITFLINSAAHKWGNRPIDKNIRPAQNHILSFLILGEGYHNFHHVFPWDYQTSELGLKVNITTWFIQFFAWIGWAYDLKKVPEDVIQRRKLRTGDES